MSSIKKRRISKYNFNNSISCVHVPSSISQAHVKECISEEENTFSLTDLPNEIILHIFEYLYPSDLIAFSKMGNKRLKDLTYSIEYANFSSCRKVDAEHITSYFCRNRVKLIKRINFNNTKYLKPQLITGIAGRCKNLIELSVVKCNITYQNLIKILTNCKFLEKLSCDSFEEIEPIPKIEFPVIKTVNLFVKVTFSVSLLHVVDSVHCILDIFPNMKLAWIYFTFDTVLSLPYIRPWVQVSGLTDAGFTKKYIIITNGLQLLSFPSLTERCFDTFEHFFAKHNHYKGTSLLQSLSEGRYGIETFVFSAYAQIKSNISSLSMLTSGYSNISSLSILLTSEILGVSQKFVEGVNHAAGTRLKQLYLQEVEELLHKSKQVILVICDMLEKILQISTYITDLNLLSVHFDKVSPFKAVCKLTFLKTLIIPSCAFPESHEKKENGNQMAFQLKDVVKACPLVETFSLTFCSICSKEPDECVNASLIPIQGWKDLKKLSLYSIPLPSCYFLRKVSETCKKLESLSLITFTIYRAINVPDIIYFLQNVKTLKFIQINDENFNPMYERFWDIISDCVNLEGICILTEFRGYIEKQKILRAIQKLKYLQTFHFSAHHVPNLLYIGVKRSLLNNGVVDASDLRSISSKIFNHNFFRQPYYVHRLPNYCCLRPHVK